MSATKIKILKILEILKETDETYPLTAQQIGRKLKLYGIEAERKSICRDINTLIDFGYDIISCPDNKCGFYMASREFEDWELKVLIDAVWQANFLTFKDSMNIENKLKALASENSKRLLSSVRPIKPIYQSCDTTAKIYIDSILKAIKQNRKIQFKYSYLDVKLEKQLRRKGKPYIVNPYALAWKNDRYYLVGNYNEYDDLSFYRLDRIAELNITKEQIKSAKEILGKNYWTKLQDYIQLSPYNFGGEKITLVLEVKDYMIDDLIDYFGKGIRIQKNGDYLKASVSAVESEGLYYWLLQYEANVKVISPESVKKTLLEKVKGILELYGQT